MTGTRQTPRHGVNWNGSDRSHKSRNLASKSNNRMSANDALKLRERSERQT